DMDVQPAPRIFSSEGRMQYKEISANYLAHMGDDLMVVNAARASFGKASVWADPETKTLSPADSKLMAFLARGYTSGEWDGLLSKMEKGMSKLEAEQLALELMRKSQHWAPFAHPQI